MKTIGLVYLLALTLCLTLSAQDKDTIPLGKPSSKPSEQGQGSIIKPGGKAEAKPAQPIEMKGEEAGPEEMPKPYVASVETYGSARINEIILRETLGKDLDNWLKMGLAGEAESVKVESQLADKVKQKFGFPVVEWSVVQYFEPGDMALHITLDIVEKDDVAKRMPFLPEPTAELKDPEGLIKAWMEYEDIALDLVESGALEPETEQCPAFHCPFGHKHPQLQKFEKQFVGGATKHAKELVEIQSKDKRGDFRAAATYLLAYLKDGKKVISYMVDRIKDPDAAVRNNALRVLGDIAEFHTELIIPHKTVIEAFNFPRVSDRSKAVYLAYLLSMNSQAVREEIMKTSVPTLIQMMASKQPDHKELSHAILRKVSGKDFPNNDQLAWTNWFNRLSKDRIPSKSGK